MDELKQLVVKLGEGLKVLGAMIAGIGEEVESYAASKAKEKEAAAPEAPPAASEPVEKAAEKKPAAKKAPKVKKAAGKVAGTQKAVKKPAAKSARVPGIKKASEPKPKAPTAQDVVLEIVRAGAQGASLEVIQEKSGFDKKKVSNCLHKLKKAGLVKNVTKGVYAAA